MFNVVFDADVSDRESSEKSPEPAPTLPCSVYAPFTRRTYPAVPVAAAATTRFAVSADDPPDAATQPDVPVENVANSVPVAGKSGVAGAVPL